MDYAYDGTDPSERSELIKRRGELVLVKFSMYPEYYMPMCRKCHAAFDHPGEVTENPDW